MNHNFAEYWNITNHAYDRYILRKNRMGTYTPTDISKTMNMFRQDLAGSIWVGTSESDNSDEVKRSIADNTYGHQAGSAVLMNNQTLFIIRGLEVATVIVAPFSNKLNRIIENVPHVPEVEKILYINQAMSQENRNRYDVWGNILEPMVPDAITFFEKELVIALRLSSNTIFANGIAPNLTKVGKRAYSTDYALVLAQECNLNPLDIAEALARNIQCPDLEAIVYKNGKIKFKLKYQTENNISG